MQCGPLVLVTGVTEKGLCGALHIISRGKRVFFKKLINLLGCYFSDSDLQYAIKYKSLLF